MDRYSSLREGSTQPLTENTIKTIRLLAVTRDAAVVRLLGSMEQSNAWHLETASGSWEGMERMQSGIALDLLVLDIPRKESDPLHFLRWMSRLKPSVPVVLLCYPEDAERVQEATRLGAADILVRPFHARQLESVIRGHLQPAENDEADAATSKSNNLARIHFSSAPARSCRSFVPRRHCWRRPMSQS
jgi:DNA-binding NtrC family response regulator